jgi:hypothetical protein
VVERADLLERVRERVVADVVKKSGGANNRLLALVDRLLCFAEQREGAA